MWASRSLSCLWADASTGSRVELPKREWNIADSRLSQTLAVADVNGVIEGEFVATVWAGDIALTSADIVVIVEAASASTGL